MKTMSATRRRIVRRRIAFVALLLSVAAGLAVGRGCASVHRWLSECRLAVQASAATVPVREAGSSDSNRQPDSWNLLLVNKAHPLPEDFKPSEMTRLSSGYSVDSRVYPDLQRMMDACREQGMEPMICSAYRSSEKQSELFEKKVQSCLSDGVSRQEAEEQAAVWVNRPGTSEHQTGMALDIVDKSYQFLDEKQEETEVQKWLMAHCAEYGFILRYPADKERITGVSYEPWHYRYVGGGCCAGNYGRRVVPGGILALSGSYWRTARREPLPSSCAVFP